MTVLGSIADEILNLKKKVNKGICNWRKNHKYGSYVLIIIGIDTDIKEIPTI